MAKKFYGVRAGRTPGVYDNWLKCKEQIDGYANAIFKSFSTREEALDYVNNTRLKENRREQTKPAADIFVDGSYCKSRYSWAFAVYQNGKLIFSDSGVGEDPVAAKMNNVAGELAGAINAIQWAENNDVKPIALHHDYMGIAAWAEGSWQAKNEITMAYKNFAATRLGWIQFEKVTGHTGIAGNELVDKLAKAALGI